jgi:SAM-dependent MidA family methyltransferase
MGIRMRLEHLQNSATQAQRELLNVSYERLCDPKQMGEIYKFFFLGHKDLGDVYPFLGEETLAKEEFYK